MRGLLVRNLDNLKALGRPKMSLSLDLLDLGIMKMLLVNNGVPPPGSHVLKISFRSMAKAIGVDQATVRKRIKKLQEQRVLKGWYLGVNPGLTGQDVVYAWFNVENESGKEDAIERLLTLPSLERTCNYLGTKLKMIALCDKGTAEKTLDQLVRLAGTQAVLRQHAFLEVPAIRLSETDLAIIGSLRRDPWKPYSAVAKELGLSTRTVKRRAEKLSEDGEIYMLPIIDYRALQGIIPVDLIVDYASRETRSTVNERITSYIKEELMFSGRFGHKGYFSLMVPNVSQVEQIAKWVRRLEGVREAHADALQEVVLNRSHFERMPLPLMKKVEARVDA